MWDKPGCFVSKEQRLVPISAWEEKARFRNCLAARPGGMRTCDLWEYLSLVESTNRLNVHVPTFPNLHNDEQRP